MYLYAQMTTPVRKLIESYLVDTSDDAIVQAINLTADDMGLNPVGEPVRDAFIDLALQQLIDDVVDGVTDGSIQPAGFDTEPGVIDEPLPDGIVPRDAWALAFSAAS